MHTYFLLGAVLGVIDCGNTDVAPAKNSSPVFALVIIDIADMKPADAMVMKSIRKHVLLITRMIIIGVSNRITISQTIRIRTTLLSNDPEKINTFESLDISKKDIWAENG